MAKKPKLPGDFEDIRCYGDEETSSGLQRMAKTPKTARLVLGTLAPKLLRFPWLLAALAPLVTIYLRLRLGRIRTVRELQEAFLKPYVVSAIKRSCDSCTYASAEPLDKDGSYLYISNHRDILFDLLLANYTQHLYGHKTLRIAVGENLMTEQIANDLIRMNKGIKVKRSFESPRQALSWHRTFSSYLYNSVVVDGCSVWIAQAGGRSKDGNDRTDTGLIKMLSLPIRDHKMDIDFGAYIRSLNIVPISVSYEYDPGDVLKAREVHAQTQQEKYQKSEGEDDQSIITGVLGYKGRTHLAYGVPLAGDYNNAADVAEALDRAIVGNYVLFPTNYFAYRQLHGHYPEGQWGFPARDFKAEELDAERQRFETHIESIDSLYQPYVLEMYANPLVNQLALAA